MKSSYSLANGDCVEVGFRKSTFSGDTANCVEVAFGKATASAGNGACVEVGTRDCDEVLVRDSKDPSGPVLRFTPDEWTAFTEGVRGGEFDL